MCQKCRRKSTKKKKTVIIEFKCCLRIKKFINGHYQSVNPLSETVGTCFSTTVIYMLLLRPLHPTLLDQPRGLRRSVRLLSRHGFESSPVHIFWMNVSLIIWCKQFFRHNLKTVDRRKKFHSSRAHLGRLSFKMSYFLLASYVNCDLQASYRQTDRQTDRRTDGQTFPRPVRQGPSTSSPGI